MLGGLRPKYNERRNCKVVVKDVQRWEAEKMSKIKARWLAICYWAIILLKCWVTKDLWNVTLHKFRTFMWISTNFTQCSLRYYHSQAILSQVLRKMGSENAHGFAWNTENDFDFSFEILERYHKYGNESINQVVLVPGEGSWVLFVNVKFKEQRK
jgi:hypothetical protein